MLTKIMVIITIIAEAGGTSVNGGAGRGFI